MKNRNFQNAFSLMEMMIVLLIVAIIAAATAPMVTKKMMRTAGSGDSPWVFTGLNNNIAYNMAGSDNTTAIIGATSLPRGWDQHTRLFIDSGDNASHIAFGNGNATPLLLTADPDKGRIGFSNAIIPDESVAFGTGQTLNNSKIVAIGSGVTCGSEATAVGHGAEAKGQQSVAIGELAGKDSLEDSNGSASVSVGYSSQALGNRAVAIGANTLSQGKYSITIGSNVAGEKITYAALDNSIAIGAGAQATGGRSVAIGPGAVSTSANQIVLGTDQETVYIPGNLIVDGTVMLSMRGSTGSGAVGSVYLRESDGDRDIVRFGRAESGIGAFLSSAPGTVTVMGNTYSYYRSDRRLKNVGEKYTAGLEELKKLDFYHYTFKADKDNTPLVGVMAQDLQKVFPDAVTKGEDGYLRIRLEDMFYAVINAVKELDAKVSQIVADVTGISSKVDEQQKVIEAQQQKIEELEKVNADFEKRLAKLEKKNKKFEE